MPDYSDDSDEELGAYIYSISRTAQLLREEAAAARNNELTTNNDNNDDNITMPKRKSPHEVENTSVSSEPKERMKKKRKGYINTCSNEGCTNQVVSGGVCASHGAKVKRKTCSYEGCTKYARKGGVCTKHGAEGKKYTCSHEGCTKLARKGGVCWNHGAKKKT